MYQYCIINDDFIYFNFCQEIFQNDFVNYHLWINNPWNYYTVQIFIMHLLFTVIILNKKTSFWILKELKIYFI